MTTYIERDVRQIKNIGNLHDFQTVMALLAARTGSELNANSIMSQTGISAPTVKSWFSILETSYLSYTLTPYTRNISKRVIKSPKLYFTDCGILCALLGISTVSELKVHPLHGAVFENMVVTEFLKTSLNQAKRPNLYFYRERSSPEVDIIQELGFDRLRAFEVKSSATFNPAFMSNLDYLKGLLGDTLTRTDLIYTGATIPPTSTTTSTSSQPGDYP